MQFLAFSKKKKEVFQIKNANKIIWFCFVYSIFLKEKEIKLEAKNVYIYEFLFGICTKEKKKSHPKFSFIYIRKRANLWFSTMHVFLICFPPLSGSPLSPYFLFRLSWNIFTSWKFNHYLPALWTTIYITSKRGKLLLFCHI